MPPKLRLLFVTEYFPPAVLGGAEMSTLAQASALVRGGHEVTVLTPRYGGAEQETTDGVRILRFRFPVELGTGQAAKPLWFQNPLYYLYLAILTWRYARSARVDIVHAQNSFSVVGAYVGARLAGCRFAVTMRDYMHLCSGGAICLHDEDLPPRRCSLAQYRKCFHQFQKKYHPHAGAWKQLKASVRHVVETLDVKTRQWVLGHADRVVTVSDAVGRIHLAAGLLSEEPVTVYNVPPERVPADGEGETRARWGVPENAPLVLYVGKQSFGKGTDVLLEAARRVLEASPSVHFLIVGRKEPLIPMPDDPRVIATGPLPHEDVMKLYPAADVVVLPAVWKEPFPRTLLEAMAAGKPVVATRSGGIPELVVDEESGILVASKDAEALARALCRVCDDRALAERLGRRGRMRLEHEFGASSSLSRLLSVYEDLATGGS